MRRGLVITAALCALGIVHVRGASEVRALWVVRTSLTSPAAVATMVDAARASGFTTLLAQIRGRGDAYYAQALEPRAPFITPDPVFDPLAATLARGHAAGLEVHAWINVNLIASAHELPAAREHVIYRHPEWLMVPRALAADLAAVDPHSPEYLGRLARYIRAQPAELEGLYLSPVAEVSADYTVRVVQDIVSRYDIDGVHFDFVRYPNDEFDYSREALTEFRRYVAPDLPPADIRRYDSRLPAEPLIYTQAFPERWSAFRKARMTSLMRRLQDAVRRIRPSATISAAVMPDPVDAAARRLQDWRSWVDAGLIDAVCPMAYTTDSRLFATQIAKVREVAGRLPVWAGIGAYRLSSTQIVEYVQTTRRLGAGIALFSYDSLTDPPHGTEYLAEVARTAFASQ